MFAVLEFWDFAAIVAIVMIFAGGTTSVVSYFQPKDEMRLKRLEAKVDLLLKCAALTETDRAELREINEYYQVARLRPKEPNQ